VFEEGTIEKTDVVKCGFRWWKCVVMTSPEWEENSLHNKCSYSYSRKILFHCNLI